LRSVSRILHIKLN